MIALQVINKVLQSQSVDLITNNELSVDYFIGYENEYEFIINHYKEYGNVPNKTTFLATFNEWDFIEVTETDRYLVDTIREEYLYYKTVPVIQKSAELLKSNANDAVSFLLEEVKNLTPSFSVQGTDIIKHAPKRYETYANKTQTVDWFIPTGFSELDDIIHGWSKGEELAVIFARTGQGKSWLLGKTLSHAWQIGYRVGYISPEMSPEKIGYRFDTLTKHFSNTNLLWGKDEPDYKEHIMKLTEHKNEFIVATPQDFQKKITVTKLKAFVKSNNLDILGVDGITYLTDERYKRGDSKTISLTNISEDLLTLSNELKIPILVVVQSNRGGVKDADSDGTPELENIRDSDGIAQNATKVIALRQAADSSLECGIKKHRDGKTGGKVIYDWNIDKGIFTYIPSYEDGVKPEKREQKVNEIKSSFGDGTNVF